MAPQWGLFSYWNFNQRSRGFIRRNHNSKMCSIKIPSSAHCWQNEKMADKRKMFIQPLPRNVRPSTHACTHARHLRRCSKLARLRRNKNSFLRCTNPSILISDPLFVCCVPEAIKQASGAVVGSCSVPLASAARRHVVECVERTTPPWVERIPCAPLDSSPHLN